MNAAQRIISHRRIILSITAILVTIGIFYGLFMKRQEDPRLPNFWGQVTAWYPGADAEMVERLVLNPIEDELAQVSTIKDITSTAYDEMTVIEIELIGETSDFKTAWDDVREALEKAERRFPEGVEKPSLNDDLSDQDSVVLALSGSPDPIVLLQAARKVKDRLITLKSVSRIHFIAPPEEQVTIDLSDPASRKIKISPTELAHQLGGRSRTLQGGSLNMDGRTHRLRPLTEFGSIDEIRSTKILLPSGKAVPLEEIAGVRLGPSEPLSSIMRFNGVMCMGVAVVPKASINTVEFGNDVERAVEKIRPEIHPITLDYVMFQPDRTKDRIDELSRSLLMGVLIVAGVLVITMGLRIGFLVSMLVPLITLISLALFGMGGGILHQVSIAAFVLSLGMLVDNAIVVTENVKYRMDQGESSASASQNAIKELWLPLLGATATTIAAFVPMLLATGPTALFTRSVPVVVIVTLSVSYLFAIFVTPILSQIAITPSDKNSQSFLDTIGKKTGQIAIRFPKGIMLATAVLVCLSLSASFHVKRQFFPVSDRNQLTIDIKLPEGSHLSATDSTARALEKELTDLPSVRSVASFIGRSAPHFYYNIPRIPFSPHYAQMVIETRSTDDLVPLMEKVRSFSGKFFPHAEIVPRKIEQGPPVAAPIVVRISGTDITDLAKTANTVSDTLRSIRGSVDVRSDKGPGAPVISLKINDAEAMRNGITRADVATTLGGRVRGLLLGTLRTSEDPIPIKIRSAKGESMTPDDLVTMDVVNGQGKRVPLSELAHLKYAFRPAAIHHKNFQRVVHVFSQLAQGTAYNEVLDPLKEKLKGKPPVKGVTIDFGGEAEGTDDANTSLMKRFPIGMILLLSVLLIEFNSFRRIGIILLTIPLAAAGVVPGLLVGREPFGFMSLLGGIALIGIVVNNAILLLERVESQRNLGKKVEEAVTDAVERRIRPILLTSSTTIAGLLPLALSQSTLWPPLAWAMISGLFASTLLTLLVIPSVYTLLFRKEEKSPFPPAALPIGAAMMALMMIPSIAQAQTRSYTLSLSEVIARSKENSLARAKEEERNRSMALEKAEKRTAYLPTLSIAGSVSKKLEDLELKTPLGNFPIQNEETYASRIQLVQPLLKPDTLFFGSRAAETDVRARTLRMKRDKSILSREAAWIYLDIFSSEATMLASSQYMKSLQARLMEVKERISRGKSIETDRFKIQLALDQAALDLKSLSRKKDILMLALSKAINESDLFVLDGYPDLELKALPEKRILLEEAFRKRSDYLASIEEEKMIALRKKEVHASALPSLELTATHTFDEASPYETENWTEGALTVKWIPFHSGTRNPKAAALSAQERAIRNQLMDLRKQIEIEVESGLIDIEISRETISKERKGVLYSEETLRVETERFNVGKTTTNDLLDALTLLRRSQTALENARIGLVRAWIDLSFSTGDDIERWMK